MPWGRLDDSLYDHPKLDEFPTDEPTLRHIVDSLELEDLVRLAGIGLWARSISYANRHLTDGAVSRSVIVRKLGGSAALADAVSNAELFDPGSTGFVIHDFLEFNDSRVDVLERRQKEAERKAAWRASKRAGGRPAGSPAGTSSVDDDDVPVDVPPSVPAGQERPSRRLSRDSRARSRGIRESRPDPTRPIDSPQPPASGGPSRANGTSPRARAQAAADLAAIETKAKSYRREQRKLAYARGAITQAQLDELNGRDAPLTDIPGWTDHQARLAAEAESPVWMRGNEPAEAKP